jgi:hypothetical protein
MISLKHSSIPNLFLIWIWWKYDQYIAFMYQYSKIVTVTCKVCRKEDTEGETDRSRLKRKQDRSDIEPAVEYAENF